MTEKTQDAAEVKTSGIESVEDALGKTEKYIEEHQKILSIILGVIILIVIGYLAFKKFYIIPLEEEAKSQMFVAEQYFQKDSFKLALNGYAGYPGFIAIADDYGMTRAGNVANYYAGICYLRLGEYKKAIEYLEEFDSSDKISKPVALAAIGDCYMELNDTKKAIKYYLKAAKQNENNFTTPIFLMKAGMSYEVLKDYQSALEIYKQIEEEYPTTPEGRKIKKYISRASYKAGNK